ncbi:uncharacterized protein LOC107266872 [Cephus cinctus]|uniref:Uncharacterized protein LOC107266872 n=1 Tax=Cephus cinctus TaxID=211228 RepID=A0AAJ7BSM2_CEPCN|nr:uncharacterized protein LOC107266872 [Cephus cinctus]
MIMILEADEETRDFITVYKKDYRSKRLKKGRTQYSDNHHSRVTALHDVFKEFDLSADGQSEDFMREYDVNKSFFDCENKKYMKSLYQTDYSKNSGDYLSLRAKNTGENRPKITLPKDWLIPETVHRTSYRNPRDMSSNVMFQRKTLTNPGSSLAPNAKEREILQVTTGTTEYERTISSTAAQIIRERLLGEPLPLEPVIKETKDTALIRSECSSLLKSQKHSAFFKVF